MGWIYDRKGVFAVTAAKFLEEASAKEASPRRPFHLGLACAKSGERDRAKEIIDAALQLDPKLTQDRKSVV